MKQTRKINKDRGIEECCIMMVSGTATRDIVSNLTENYGVSRSTVEKWIKIARPKAEARQAEFEEVRLREMDAATVDALKQGLKSDLELEAFLCQMAMGDIKMEEVVMGIAVLRDVSPSERIKAVDLIYKKRGSYAAIKNDLTLSGIVLIEGETDTADEPIKD